MSKQSSVRFSNKSNLKKPNDKGYSLYHLHQINARLQNEQIEAKKFLQRMKQQQSISKKVDKLVQEEIVKVQNGGIYFASRLEEEKRKNNLLQNLVTYYQSLIYNDKVQKYEQMMKTKTVYKNANRKPESEACTSRANQTQNSEDPTNKHLQLEEKTILLKQLEKDYDQLILKSNSSKNELSKKLDEVRTLRSERTVFNKLFDQFEKQIFDHEFIYKQLVIERSVLENDFEKKVQQFQQLEVKAQKEYQKIFKNQQKRLSTCRTNILQDISTRKDQTTINLNNLQHDESVLSKKNVSKFKEKENYSQTARNNSFEESEDIKKQDVRFSVQQYKNAPSVQLPRKVNFQTPQNQNNSKVLSSRFKNNSYLHHRTNTGRRQFPVRKSEEKNQSKYYYETSNLQYEKKVKQIYEDLHINNIEFEQISELAENIDEVVHQLYEKAQHLYEKIYNKQKQGKEDNSQEIDVAKLKDAVQKQKKRTELVETLEKAELEHTSIQQEIEKFATIDLREMYKTINLQADESFSKEEKGVSLEQLLQKMSKLQQSLSTFITFPTFNQSQYSKSIHYAQHNLIERQHHQKRDTRKSEQMELKLDPALDKFKHSYSRQMRDSQNQYDIKKLQQILKANKALGNNNNSITLYTEEEFIEKSRFDLNKVNRKNQSSTSLQRFSNASSRNKKSQSNRLQNKQNIVKE